MDGEIDAETRRQIRRAASIMQDAFEGLRTLHNRMSETVRMQRVATVSTSPPTTSLRDRHRQATTEVTAGEIESRRSMDPGHDAIVLSSSAGNGLPGESEPPTASSTGSLGRRPSDPTLVSLASEFLASTQGFRERANEFTELQRAITQYRNERRGLAAEGVRSRSPARNSDPVIPPAISGYLRTFYDTRAQTDAGTPGASSMVADAAFGTRGSGAPPELSQVRDERTMLSRSLRRRRSSSESATSLGLMVAARTAASRPNTSNISSSSDTPSFAIVSAFPTSTVGAPSTAGGRSSASSVPVLLVSRMDRLAREIHNDYSRIAQQGESLISWINDSHARFNTSTTRPSNATANAAPTAPTRGDNTVATQIPPVAPSDPFPTTTLEDARYESSLLEQSLTSSTAQEVADASARLREQLHEGTGTMPRAIPIRPRRTPEVAVRARYLRNSVPTSWSATSPSASTPREERIPSGINTSRLRERVSDGPLSPPSRTIAPPSAHAGTRVGTAVVDAATPPASIFDDPIVVDAADRLRAVIARTRAARREAHFGDDEEEITESRNYRVRRRYNADGDEEIAHIPQRGEIFQDAGRTRNVESPPGEEAWEEDDDEPWLDALNRLDTMSRQSGTASDARSRWGPPPMTRGGTQMGTVGDPNSWILPVGLARRSEQAWPRLGDSTPAEEEGEYERDLAAMRARAQSLLSSTPPPRTLGGAQLPPPPPTTRPLSFVPTTQGASSLWNDSSVRVRIRTAARQVDENMRRTLGTDRRDRRSYMPFSMPPPSPPLERSGRESSARYDRAATHSGPRDQQRADLEQPVWGSPTPFYPSPLPLPLAEEAGSLQVRSKVFSGAKKVARMPRRRSVVVQAGR